MVPLLLVNVTFTLLLQREKKNIVFLKLASSFILNVIKSVANPLQIPEQLWFCPNCHGDTVTWYGCRLWSCSVLH